MDEEWKTSKIVLIYFCQDMMTAFSINSVKFKPPCLVDCWSWGKEACVCGYVWMLHQPSVSCCVYSVKLGLSMNGSILTAESSGIFLRWNSPATSESALFCSSPRLWCWKSLKTSRVGQKSCSPSESLSREMSFSFLWGLYFLTGRAYNDKLF